MDRTNGSVFLVIVWWIVAALWAGGTAPSAFAEGIALVSPAEHTDVIAKKPVIRCRVDVPFDFETLVVILDANDLTGLAIPTATGFEVSPIHVLAPGGHTLSVSLVTRTGETLDRSFDFSSRHSTWFREAVSNDDLTMMYEGVLTKDNQPYIPYSKVEGNLAHRSSFASETWAFSLTANARHLDQSLHVDPPLDKGVDLVDYLFRAHYRQNALSALFESGHVTIDQSPNTLSGFVREGNRVQADYKGFGLSAFMVTGREQYGFNGDLYRHTGTDHRIMGVTGSARLFSEALTVKTHYVSGTEPGEAFGFWSDGGDKKGNVLGVSAASSLFDGKLSMDAEFDLSDYDGDQSDEFSSERDKAYRFKVGSFFDAYSIDAEYGYMGPDYAVIGNAFMPGDRESVSLRAGARYAAHDITVSASQSRDNVEKDALFPQCRFHQYALDYGFTGYPSLPMRLSYGKNLVKSSREPAFTPPTDMDSDTVSGQMTYMTGPWTLGLQTGYSLQDDRTEANSDTRSLSVSLSPAFSAPRFSVSPCFGITRSDYRVTDVATDTYSANLDIRTELIERTLSLDLSGCFNRVRADDRSSDMDTLSADTRLTVLICDAFWRLVSPTVALVGRYEENRDRVYDTRETRSSVMIVLTNALALSY
ncbi:hypothetical protein JCM14469_03380 [Desulfatiferula olefinivorans]